MTLSASSNSGLPVTLASATPTVCTLVGNTAFFLTAGTCDIHANQAGNATYAVAPLIAYGIDVHPIVQTINFTTVATPVYPLTKVTLSATATSGLTVSFASITPTICTVSGTTASLLTAGNCYLHALQNGNPDYAAAPIVTQQVVVTHLTQAITFPAIASQIVGANVTWSHGQLGAGGRLCIHHSRRLHGCGHNSLAAHLRHLHPAGHAGGQRGLQRRSPGAAECGRASGRADDYLPDDCEPGGWGQRDAVGHGGSGLAVSFTSATTSVWTVTGTTATMLQQETA